MYHIFLLRPAFENVENPIQPPFLTLLPDVWSNVLCIYLRRFGDAAK